MDCNEFNKRTSKVQVQHQACAQELHVGNEPTNEPTGSSDAPPK